MWEVQLYGRIEQIDLTTLQSWLIDWRIKPTDLVRFGERAWSVAQNVPELRQLCAAIKPEDRASRSKLAVHGASQADRLQLKPALPDSLPPVPRLRLEQVAQDL